MWFGIVFAVLVEIVPMRMRSSIVGIFMFVINNIGGNLPIIVDPIAKYIGYRESISIFYAGFYGISKELSVKTIQELKILKLICRLNSFLHHNVFYGTQ